MRYVETMQEGKSLRASAVLDSFPTREAETRRAVYIRWWYGGS
jgi:hypothetical protein